MSPHQPFSIPSLLLALATLVATAAGAAETNVTSQPMDRSALAAEHIPFSGQLVSALAVRDVQGPHILILTSTLGPSRTVPTKSRTERTDLQARYFTRTDGKWTEAWAIKDFVDCPYLTSSATFMTRNVTVTDLNQDGNAEITVPYTTVCGDRVTPILTVVVRQGAESYAFHGQSLIRAKDSASLGRTYKADDSLSLQKNAVYRQHLDSVWYQITSNSRDH